MLRGGEGEGGGGEGDADGGGGKGGGGEGGGGEGLGGGGKGTGGVAVGSPVRHWQVLPYPGAGSTSPKDDFWQTIPVVPVETGYQSLQRLQVG